MPRLHEHWLHVNNVLSLIGRIYAYIQRQTDGCYEAAGCHPGQRTLDDKLSCGKLRRCQSFSWSEVDMIIDFALSMSAEAAKVYLAAQQQRR